MTAAFYIARGKTAVQSEIVSCSKVHLLVTGRNEVVAKVMFLHVFVILLTGGSTGRENPPGQGEHPPPPGQADPPQTRQTPPWPGRHPLDQADTPPD